jgi:hypothetical protein
MTRFKDTPSHAGRLKQRNCTLREAVVDYSLKTVNDTVSFLPWDESYNTTKYAVVREVERSGMTSRPSTCGGLWRALHDKYTAAASISYTGPSYAVRTNDSTARQYLIANDEGNSIWRDPMPDMLAMARELSLRVAIMATPNYPYSPPELRTAAYHDIVIPPMQTINRTLSQSTNATRSYSEVVYQSNFGFLGGALAVILLATCAILALFKGWWHIGRNMTLSPFELAGAFDAPLLAHADGNATANELIRVFGPEHVQYGVSQRERGTVGKEEAEAASVKSQHIVTNTEAERPIEESTGASDTNDMIDLDSGSELRQRSVRLHFDRPEQVSMANSGDVF